jgi:antitoxin PrlF
MKTSTMTTKGQVTVPKELRDAFGWTAGDEVEFVLEADGVKILAGKPGRKGTDIVDRLRRAHWDPSLTTAGLMTMTRGRRR